MKKKLPYPLRVALIFLAFSLVWIKSTDQLVLWLFREPDTMTLASTYKGWFFVLASAVLIYLLLRQEQRERDRAEQKKGESEVRYRSLFEHMLNGLAYCRMLYQDGKPQDFIYLEVNSAFEKLTGLKNAVGKKVTELIPGIRESNPELFEIYGRAAATGRPEVFETHLAGLDMWFSISVYSPEKNFFVAVFDVITERKLAEEKLREEEARIHLALDAARGGAWEWNLQTNQNIWSDELWKIYGLEPHSCEPSYEVWLQTIRPEDREAASTAVQAAARDGTELNAEWRVQDLDGTERWLMSRGQPVLDPNGRPARFIGTVLDITERKRAEAALRESENRYRELVQDANSAIIRWRRDGTILFFNEYAQKFFGYSAEEVVGKHADILLPGKETTGSDLSTLIQSIVDNPERYQNNVNENVCRDGRRVWVTWTNKPIRDENGQITEVLAVGSDITERKRAEEELQRSKVFLDSVIEQSPHAMWIADAQGTLIRLNQACRDLLNIVDEEVVGKYNVLQDNIVEEQGFIPLVKRVFENGETARFTLRYATQELKSLPLSHPASVVLDVTISPVMDVDGRVTNAIIQHVDVTERKRAEEQLRQSEAALNQAQHVAQVGSWVWHIQSDRLEWSEEMYRIFGIEKESFSGDLNEVIDRSIHPDDRAAVAESNRSVAEIGKPTPLEYRVVHPNGTIRTVWAEAGELVLDGAGNPAMLTGIVQDITKRKEAEEALRESEERFRRIFQESQFGITIAGPDYHFADANPAFCKMIGYTVEELRRLTFADITAPENLKVDTENVQAMARGEISSYKTEKKYKKKDGSILWGNLVVSGIRGGGGKIIYFLAMVEDMTERKQAEEMLHHQALMLDIAPVSITVHDADGRFLYTNEKTLELHRYTRSEYMALTLHQIDVPESEALIAERMDLLERTGAARFEVEHYRKDGSTFPLEVDARYVEWSGEPAILSIGKDITERKLADDALRESEQRYRSLAEASHDMIFILDREGRIQYVNGFAAAQFNRQPEELVGVSQSELFPPEITRRQLTNVGKVFETGEPLYIEAPNSSLETPTWLGTWLVPLRSPAGEVDSVMGVSRDITERRRAEEALRQREEDYRQLFEAESDAIFLIDNATGQILEANEAACRLFGYSRNELLAMKNTDLSAEPEETTRISRETPVEPDQLVDIPLRYTHNKAGIVFPVEITGRFFVHQGRPVHISAMRDITERKKAEEKLKAALEEKEVLLREVHHRVKNNLQAMIYLIEMQSAQIKSESTRQFLRELQEQARAMSLVYEQLYQSDNLAQVAMQPYLQQIAIGVVQAIAPEREIKLDLKLAPVSLDVSLAMPCGLIVNELITNTIKYAFPETFKGSRKLSISFKVSRDKCTLVVADNGIGLPEGTDWRKSKSLGLRLVNMWATHQLGGSLDVAMNGGAAYTITFRTKEKAKSGQG